MFFEEIATLLHEAISYAPIIDEKLVRGVMTDVKGAAQDDVVVAHVSVTLFQDEAVRFRELLGHGESLGAIELRLVR